MNPRAEFIKAIMSVLRLDSNIYTTGAIETIIDRLEVSDYQLFIAYLGERKSEFEKPIESIAKGVEEFYLLKLEPHKDKAKKMFEEITGHIEEVRTICRNQAEAELNKDDIEKQVQKDYGKQSEQIQENQRYNLTRETLNIKSIELYEKFLEKKQDDEFFKKFIYTESEQPIFTKEILDVIYGIGGLKVATDTQIHFYKDVMQPCRAEIAIMEYFLRGKYKPNVTEQIKLKEDGDIKNQLISNNVRKLLENVNKYQ